MIWIFRNIFSLNLGGYIYIYIYIVIQCSIDYYIYIYIYIYIRTYIAVKWTLNDKRKWQDTGNSTGSTRSSSVKNALWKSVMDLSWGRIRSEWVWQKIQRYDMVQLLTRVKETVRVCDILAGNVYVAYTEL